MSDIQIDAERTRLAALSSYDVLDTSKEEAFDRITRLACKIFGVPIAAISFIDESRQWFKSCSLQTVPTALPRRLAPCNLTIHQSEPLIVFDTHQDRRFDENPYVVGPPHIRFYASAQLISASGHAIGTLCIIDERPRTFTKAKKDILQELAQIVMHEMELRRLAMNDSLTGALARRAFRVQAEHSIHTAIEAQSHLALIAFDLDHFKRINDRYGHLVGDKVLIACVDACKHEFGAFDFLGRLGGEEFAALLVGYDPAEAMRLAERVRKRFTQLGFSIGDEIVQISASFGVTILSPADNGLDDMLARADSALYRAKHGGRNTCIASFPTYDGLVPRAALSG